MQTKQRKVLVNWNKLFKKLTFTGYGQDSDYITVEPMSKIEVFQIRDIANTLGFKNDLFHPDHNELGYFSKLDENYNIPLLKESIFLKVYHYVYSKNRKYFKYNLIGHSRKK